MGGNMRTSIIITIVAFCFLLTACYTHTHIVGNGAQGSKVVTARQWYAVYGLAPLNKVDSQAMAGGAKDYEITTQQSFIDGVINMFTGSFTVTCQTVTVKK
jgi:hypothetical protein